MGPWGMQYLPLLYSTVLCVHYIIIINLSVMVAEGERGVGGGWQIFKGDNHFPCITHHCWGGNKVKKQNGECIACNRRKRQGKNWYFTIQSCSGKRRPGYISQRQQPAGGWAGGRGAYIPLLFQPSQWIALFPPNGSQSSNRVDPIFLSVSEWVLSSLLPTELIPSLPRITHRWIPTSSQIMYMDPLSP